MKKQSFLDMTLHELLVALGQALGASANNEEDWIDIRGQKYPWRHIVDAAERGECEVARVGRRLLMRRQELSRWLSTCRIAPPAQKPTATVSEKDELKRQVRASLRRAGYHVRDD